MTTSSDKAKSKLLDSMRMSKQGTGATETAQPAASGSKAAAASKPAAKKKSPAKKAPGKKTPAKKAPARKSASGGNYSSREGRAQIISDVFESGRRIWPD